MGGIHPDDLSCQHNSSVAGKLTKKSSECVRLGFGEGDIEKKQKCLSEPFSGHIAPPALVFHSTSCPVCDYRRVHACGLCLYFSVTHRDSRRTLGQASILSLLVVFSSFKEILHSISAYRQFSHRALPQPKACGMVELILSGDRAASFSCTILNSSSSQVCVCDDTNLSLHSVMAKFQETSHISLTCTRSSSDST